MGLKKAIKKVAKAAIKPITTAVAPVTSLAGGILSAAGVKVPTGGLMGSILAPGVEKANEAAAAEETAAAEAETKKKAEDLLAVQAEAQRLATLQRAVPGVQALDTTPTSTEDKIALAQTEAKKKAKYSKAARSAVNIPKTILG